MVVVVMLQPLGSDRMWYSVLLVVLVVRVGAEDVTTTQDDYAVIPDTSKQGSLEGLSDVLEPPGGSNNKKETLLLDLISCQPTGPSGPNNVEDKNGTFSLLEHPLNQINSTDLGVNSTKALAKDLEISSEGNSTRTKRHFCKKCKKGGGGGGGGGAYIAVPVYVVPVQVQYQNPCGGGGCHQQQQRPNPCGGGGCHQQQQRPNPCAGGGCHPAYSNPCSSGGCGGGGGAHSFAQSSSQSSSYSWY